MAPTPTPVTEALAQANLPNALQSYMSACANAAPATRMDLAQNEWGRFLKSFSDVFSVVRSQLKALTEGALPMPPVHNLNALLAPSLRDKFEQVNTFLQEVQEYPGFISHVLEDVPLANQEAERNARTNDAFTVLNDIIVWFLAVENLWTAAAHEKATVTNAPSDGPSLPYLTEAQAMGAAIQALKNRAEACSDTGSLALIQELELQLLAMATKRLRDDTSAVGTYVHEFPPQEPFIPVKPACTLYTHHFERFVIHQERSPQLAYGLDHALQLGANQEDQEFAERLHTLLSDNLSINLLEQLAKVFTREYEKDHAVLQARKESRTGT